MLSDMQNMRSCACGNDGSASMFSPAVGTNHFVKASDLKPARKVAAAKRRRAILESAGTSRNADAVDI